MSIATSMPCIKIKVSPTHHHHQHYSNFCFRPATIVGSKAEGPLRRPGGPSVSPASPPPPPPPPLSPPPRSTVTPLKPVPPSKSPPKPVEAAEAQPIRGAVTLEYQRKAAKEMQEYFRLKKLEEANQGPFFGFIGKNEIVNGRWAMFGFAVGLLTEYATGSDFVEQLKILLSNFGILDLE